MRNIALETLLNPSISAMGYELLGVEYLPQGKHSIVRIYIDKEEGITVDDCEKVSRQVSAVLDVEDPVSGQYTLEVSSPGLDRPLFSPEQFERYLGEGANIRLRSPLEGRRKYKCELKAVEDDTLVIESDGETVRVPFDLIEKANLIPDL